MNKEKEDLQQDPEMKALLQLLLEDKAREVKERNDKEAKDKAQLLAGRGQIYQRSRRIGSHLQLAGLKHLRHQ